jgi:hypothetical protein
MNPYFRRRTIQSSQKVTFTARHGYTDYPKEPAQNHPPGMSELAQQRPDCDPRVRDFLSTASPRLRNEITDMLLNAKARDIDFHYFLPDKTSLEHAPRLFVKNSPKIMLDTVFEKSINVQDSLERAGVDMF